MPAGLHSTNVLCRLSLWNLEASGDWWRWEDSCNEIRGFFITSDNIICQMLMLIDKKHCYVYNKENLETMSYCEWDYALKVSQTFPALAS